LSDFIDRVNGQFPEGVENEELNALLTTILNQEKMIKDLEKKIKGTSAVSKNETPKKKITKKA
jgi:alpha-amylase